MTRSKRLYRVTAQFSDSYINEDGVTQVDSTRTWHYQDKRAAESRHRKCRDGWTEEWFTESGERRATSHAPAVSVTLEASEPVVFSTTAVSA